MLAVTHNKTHLCRSFPRSFPGSFRRSFRGSFTSSFPRGFPRSIHFFGHEVTVHDFLDTLHISIPVRRGPSSPGRLGSPWHPCPFPVRQEDVIRISCILRRRQPHRPPSWSCQTRRAPVFLRLLNISLTINFPLFLDSFPGPRIHSISICGFQKSMVINMSICDFRMLVFNYPYKCRYPHWYPSRDINARIFCNGYP